MEDIYIKKEQHPFRGAQEFETYVLLLLEELFARGNKPFLFGTDLDYSFIDGFATEGVPSIEGEVSIVGKTIIQVKYNLMTDRLLKEQSFFFNLIVEGIHFDNLLLIGNQNLSDNAINNLNKRLQSVSPNAKVYFWGPQQLRKLEEQFPAKSKELENNTFAFYMHQLLSKTPTDWKKQRDFMLDRLASKYQRGQMSLFLGAGLSASAGMVDWKTLLDSLFVSLISNGFNNRELLDEDIREISERFSEVQEGSSVALARYLRAGLAGDAKGEEKFIEAVREKLYKLRNTSFPLKSNLFKIISKLCMPTRTGSKIRFVITYNFDDLLERSLKENHIRCSSIYSDNNPYTLDDLPIYHVHGFLPEDSSNYNGLERNTFVFSEEGYHKIYSEPYHWSNLVQLNSLRELNCVFIGLSMTDPNLRRLLDIAAKNPDEPRHFVFMKRLDSEEFINEKKMNEKGKTEKVKKISNSSAAISFIESHLKLQEEVFRELGVSIIWFEHYEEIPKLLSKVYDLSIDS